MVRFHVLRHVEAERGPESLSTVLTVLIGVGCEHKVNSFIIGSVDS